jgi:hypothetical protein
MKNATKKRKRVLTLALAAVMAASLLALPTSALPAAGGGVGYHPPENRLLWWADEDLSVPFTETLDMVINGVEAPVVYSLGYNTVQTIELRGNLTDGTYTLTPHPQYFPVIEDLDTAQWGLEIYSIMLWYNDELREFLVNGVAHIPASLTKRNDGGVAYLECHVRGTITYVADPPLVSPIPADIPVQWDTAYLEIPSQVVPPIPPIA